MSKILDDDTQRDADDGDDDFSPLPEEDGMPAPIVPSDYATYLYILHEPGDDGRRPQGWWKHNYSFDPHPDSNAYSILLDFVLVNKGFMDADNVQLDYIILSGDEVKVTSMNFSIGSGQSRPIKEGFNIPGDRPDDITGWPGIRPWLAIRATDFTTPAPSIAEIKECFLEFALNPQAATVKLMRWKRYPSLFVYPCCAIFEGAPQN